MTLLPAPRFVPLALALLAALPGSAPAQGVLVAPTYVAIHGGTRTSSLLLVNPNDEPAEVELSAVFGYPVTDSAGHSQLYTTEEPPATEPSAAGWIKFFPRRLALAPHAQQTIRVLVSPPAGIADGEYWSRVVIVARGGQLPVTVADSTGTAAGVTVGLSMEVRTIIPLFFRQGKPATGVGLAGLRAWREGDSVVVRARIERRGSAAALGTARGELVDAQGKVHGEFATPIAVYHAAEPRFTLPAAGVPPGTYRLRFEVVATRPDLPSELVLPFPLARDSLALALP